MTAEQVDTLREILDEHCKCQLRDGSCDPDTCCDCYINDAYGELWRLRLTASKRTPDAMCVRSAGTKSINALSDIKQSQMRGL